jgi:hypothetical protein
MKSFSAMDQVNMIAKLADLRDTDYQNTLVLHALIEILIEKGVLTREELLAKVRQMDTQLDDELQLDQQLLQHARLKAHSPVINTKPF